MFRESLLAHKYCIGHGLEIGGSAHNPFGLNTKNVDLTDSMDTVFKLEEIKKCGKALPVDIVAPGDNIPLPDGSQDFMVSSHVFEHFPNPIKALLEWDRLLKNDGIIFMIVPHKERTFDRDWERTPLQHLIDDYNNGVTEPHGIKGHHDHIWVTEDIVNLINWMIDNLGVRWTIEKVQDIDDKVGNGFTIIIRKQGVRFSDVSIIKTDNHNRALRILVAALHVTGASREGGSGRFMRCVIDTLEAMGHEVISTNMPHICANEKFDLIICSHMGSIFDSIKNNPAKKICISHGLILAEYFIHGADRYISVSEEVMDAQLKRGFPSEVIPQPITIPEHSYPNKELKNILIIRREPVGYDPFAFLKEKYNLRYSNLDIPIEEQIKWADSCITLGRGALEAMAHGRPVLVADNRDYIGCYGDGYVSPENIHEIAKCNFSGRRFKHEVTREWIESELSKYNQDHSIYLHNYVKEKHDSFKIVGQYLKCNDIRMSFGVLVNDPIRLDMVLKQSEINGNLCFIKTPHSATSGLNKLLDIMREKQIDVAVLTHQDMFYQKWWISAVKAQLAKLPDNWMVAGIIGKDMQGNYCGRLHDMRMPLMFNSDHSFPVEASCFDECVIIVNLKSNFRFDEKLDGFDLYGTLAVLQAEEMGGSAWLIDAFAEHYCMRPFPWKPDKNFWKRVNWLKKRFPNARRIDSTVFGVNGEIFNSGESAGEEVA